MAEAQEPQDLNGAMHINPADAVDKTGSFARRTTDGDTMYTMHGDSAARRRAITELLFFASVGDLRRVQRIVRLWNLQVSDPACCDYDRRTPLHLAASEGSYQVSEWLLEQKADVNSLDRFMRTPLEEAIRGDFSEVAQLLKSHGGKINERQKLIPLEESGLSGSILHFPSVKDGYGLDPEWEIDPSTLTILSKLGEGEFGVVHEALWHGTHVAAKMLKASSEIALGDFRTEIEVLRRVHHPNAVQFLGACTQKEPYILVTELMPGGSLSDAFKQDRVLSLRRALELALDTARGLAYMHNRKPGPIIHRDLKPGNLMISGTPYHSRDELVYDIGMVKLADFGLSKTLPINKHASFDLESRFQLTGETGSYRYMAPEVFRHEPYNFKVDVYSFSMILYQLVESVPPFAGVDPVEAARQAAMKDRRPNLHKLDSGTPVMKELKELVQRCWSPDQVNRPDFNEIVDILDALLKKVPRKIAVASNCCAVQ